MSRLSKLKAKKGEVTLSDNEPLVVKGLTFPELTNFAEFAEKKETKGALNYLLEVTLRKAFPTKEEDPENGMTDQEILDDIKELNGDDSFLIIQKVQDLSNLGGDKKKEATLEMVKENQNNKLKALENE